MSEGLFNKVAGLRLLKRDSNTVVFLWNLRYFLEHLFSRTTANDCSCMTSWFCWKRKAYESRWVCHWIRYWSKVVKKYIYCLVTLDQYRMQWQTHLDSYASFFRRGIINRKDTWNKRVKQKIKRRITPVLTVVFL